MKTLDGTIPHYVKVQMGSAPDQMRDCQACIYVPLDESADGVGMWLAEIALSLSNASNILSSSKVRGAIINIDGTECNISIPETAQT